MNIRTKLFIFIPALVLLLNGVFLFVFQSGKQVQENYNIMMDRILLYKQATDETEQTLRSLNHYLINPTPSTLSEFTQHQRKLKKLKESPALANFKGANALAKEDFYHTVGTLIEQESEVIRSFEQKDLEAYTQRYAKAEKTARFLQEEGENLVDLELSFYQPLYYDILTQTEKMNRLGAYMVVVTILLSAGFAILLSESITHPISRLVQAARQVSKGNLAIEFPRFPERNEIGILAETFRQMLKDIRDLMAKNLESLQKDKVVKELELKALQSQINPHFLFNTLNILSNLAMIEGAEETSDLTVSVSNLIRYNLRKLDQPVTLREEINHAKEYFIIQKARFRDRVSFISEIEEEALDQLIPCLTLQPIIENAFVHGIEGMEQGAVIRLTVRKLVDSIEIRISDNGSGITEEIRSALLNFDQEDALPISKGHSTGLGTKNVFKRLHLFYGKDKLVDIAAEQPTGTTVIFNLPDKIKEQGVV
ncbi:sensor histidine kinase [Mesobacillus subterraneus]|uniref:HAMP domain-containing protein n=1 Tax=Mesobacillus subterraneus TaxID=285983 RepID=A0A0D6ZAX4_9BACI|nr:sensor histidine kinase [Mesobacillus subterraneus]KIY22191.1 hypothetical protein UB32_09795 [Mesobacillus subterraneus]